MMPKKLHYCWFGNNAKPKSFQKCLESWEQYCPDFEIIEWNETNAPNKNQSYYKNALRKHQYAFVSDSVRAEVLYTYGGIYLDTDMLLLKPVAEALKYDFFSGEEVNGRVAYGLWGSIPQHRFLKEMKAFYDTSFFDGFSPPVITHTFKQLLQKENLQGNEIIFPPEVFYALPYDKKEDAIEKYVTSESIAVHLWEHSWKVEQKETVGILIKKLRIVFSDYLFFGYPRSYFRRYAKEFGRKLFYKIFR
jgi:mannosyltransferase OCH1-like enzyme